MIAAMLSGGVVGGVLGLVGGGGSILATPLLLYAVGLAPHRAIGTGAVAVSACAFINLALHARARHVRWEPAALFAAAGLAGVIGGAELGKQVGGRHLLVLFAVLMIAVGILMLRAGTGRDHEPTPSRRPALVAATALATGTLSGFFGVGGGFLIVPALLFSTGMAAIDAIGSSLLAVGTFGAATAADYAWAALVDWRVAAEFVAGGVLGAAIGLAGASRLAASRTALKTMLGVLILVVAATMLVQDFARAA